MARTATEQAIAVRWTVARLKANAQLANAVGTYQGRANIHRYVAPSGAPLPHIVIVPRGGPEAIRFMQPRHTGASLYNVVKVVGDNASYDALDTIAVLIDAVLDGASGDVTGGHVLSSIFQQPIEYTEMEGGKLYLHKGALYRQNVQLSPF